MDWMLIKQKAEEFNEVFNKLSPEAQQNYIEVKTLNFTHNTIAIEGNRSTLLDTELLLKYDTVPKNIRLRDLIDIIAQNKAVELLFTYHRDHKEIDQDVICAFHQQLLYPAQFAGIYRTENVYVTNTKSAVTPGYLGYPEMKEFERQIKENAFADPIDKASFIHCQFVKIHPFMDGNGRTARLIMNLSLMNDGLPLIDIDMNERSNYMDAIQPYANHGDLEPFKHYLGSTIIAQIDAFLEQTKTNDLPIEVAAYKGVYFLAPANLEVKAQLGQLMQALDGVKFVSKFQACLGLAPQTSKNRMSMRFRACFALFLCRGMGVLGRTEPRPRLLLNTAAES